MHFWQSGIVVDLLILAGLLAAAALVIHGVGALRRLAVPNAIVAGVLGLTLGPSGLELIPTDIESMKLIVYHAFAVMFIAVGLQAAPKQRKGGAAWSLAVGNATIGVVQAIVGLSLVALFYVLSQPLHPGFGLMLTLGFQQGPGQALSLGGSWENLGLMPDGGQIGLIFATLGFMYCIVIGIPLVAIARRRGLITPEEEVPPAADVPIAERTTDRDDAAQPGPTPDVPGRNEPLSMQLIIIGCVYLAVFGFISGVIALIHPGDKLIATFWGMHFIVGSLLAIALRRTARRMGRDKPFNDTMLARISVVAVDITTAGAFAAVELEVLGTWLVPIVVMTAVTAVITLLGTLWLAKRAFPEASFSHALVLFGMGTGTVSTGLALLRMLDPELRGTVARNSVIGATASVPFNAPMFLFVIPFAVGRWSDDMLVALGAPLAILAVYLVALLVSWRQFTPLRLLRPLGSLWPRTPD
ncbi:MAG: hypothetical protein K0V04_04425 [Deltaproteobacteria bacterium]|nr:hypothetical protein [Deltaproteobacteria bacterium]